MPLTGEAFDVNIPINNTSPIRIALLGGEKTGKTSIITKLEQNIYTDTYYPTNRVNTSMFAYTPATEYGKLLMSSAGGFGTLETIVLSPVLFNMKKSLIPKRPKAVVAADGKEVNVSNSTDLYRSFTYKDDKAIHVTPVLVEMIDTPAYKSDFIPFLESSLYTNLHKDVLKNLANEPRRHVLTMPLLVASGAGELNGLVDGYLYVYSAVPSYNPPTYDNPKQQETSSLEILKRIKASIDEAWKEFYTYKVKWEQGKEADIYSLKGALKNLVSSKTVGEIESRKISNRGYHKTLMDYPKDPGDPSCPPPIWIICTHCKNPLASQNLITDGKQMASQWGCGFAAIDITDNSVENILALMIREISERKRLQRLRDQTK